MIDQVRINDFEADRKQGFKMLKFMVNYRRRRSQKIRKELILKYAKWKFVEAEKARRLRENALCEAVMQKWVIKNFWSLHQRKLASLVKLQAGLRMAVVRRKYLVTRRAVIRI